MSCNKTEVGLLISREPDGLQQQQQQQQLEGTTSPISNNNNNNDGEKMICENHNSSTSLEKINLREPTSDTNVLNAELSRHRYSSAEPTGHANNAHDRETEMLEGLREDSPGTLKSDGTSEDDRAKNLFRKYKLSIKNETVIVSRIDGILDSTGERSSLYKCHLCGKLGGTLEKLRRHLAAHSRKLPYRCRLCDVRFQLRPQLSFHLKTQHGSLWVGSLEAEHSAGHEATGSHKRLQVDPVTSREDVRINGSSRSCVPGVSTLRQSSDELDSSGTDVLEPPSKVSALEDAVVARKKFDFSNLNSASVFHGQGRYSFQELPQSHPISYASSSETINGNTQSSTVHSDPLKDLSDRRLSLFTCHRSKEFAEKGVSGNRVKTPVEMLGNKLEYDQNQGMDMTCKPSRLHCLSEPKNGSCPNITVLAPELFTMDLATKIRETEHLADDITVVIPSDAPFEETEAKCDVVRVGEDPESAHQNKIIHSAPHKSILGNSQLRTKRKLSVSANTPTSSSADSLPRVSHSSNHLKHPADEFSSHQMSVAASGVSGVSLPLSVYNPLALSSFVQGFNGLMSSSLLSPIITQASLGFPGMLVNPLSLYAAQLSSSSIASLMNSKVANLSAAAAAAAASLDCSSQRDLASSGSSAQQDSLHLETLAEGVNRVKEELSNSSGSGGCLSSTSEGYASPNSKCSSLSRTHSRLNVIQKPIKRENAYKPIIMSDGRTAYHCLYCNKNFCTISDVNRHMDFHEDIRPYKCRFCNYYARTNSQLKVHMMRHQGIRDFLCRLCNYKGVTQSDLNRHTKSQIHMMKERNVCTLCREGFVSPMNLEQHRIEKHLKMEACNDTNTSNVKYHLTMAGLVKENASN